jgi:hypothetical protein
VCLCQLLLTCSDALLGRDAQTGDGADALALCCGEVQQLGRRRARLQWQHVDGAAGLLQRVGDVSERLLAPLPTLRGPERVVRTLSPRRRRLCRHRLSRLPQDARDVRSASTVRAMRASTAESHAAELTRRLADAVTPRRRTMPDRVRTCTAAPAVHSSSDQRHSWPVATCSMPPSPLLTVCALCCLPCRQGCRARSSSDGRRRRSLCSSRAPWLHAALHGRPRLLLLRLWLPAE